MSIIPIPNTNSTRLAVLEDPEPQVDRSGPEPLTSPAVCALLRRERLKATAVLLAKALVSIAAGLLLVLLNQPGNTGAMPLGILFGCFGILAGAGLLLVTPMMFLHSFCGLRAPTPEQSVCIFLDGLLGQTELVGILSHGTDAWVVACPSARGRIRDARELHRSWESVRKAIVQRAQEVTDSKRSFHLRVGTVTILDVCDDIARVEAEIIADPAARGLFNVGSEPRGPRPLKLRFHSCWQLARRGGDWYVEQPTDSIAAFAGEA